MRCIWMTELSGCLPLPRAPRRSRARKALHSRTEAGKLCNVVQSPGAVEQCLAPGDPGCQWSTSDVFVHKHHETVGLRTLQPLASSLQSIQRASNTYGWEESGGGGWFGVSHRSPAGALHVTFFFFFVTVTQYDEKTRANGMIPSQISFSFERQGQCPGPGSWVSG